MNDKILIALLAHQPPSEIAKIIEGVREKLPGYDVLLIYGGDARDFDCIECTQKVFVDDIRLRTVDHQRERQSYAGVMWAVEGYLKNRHYGFVLFMEYDCLPLRADLPAALLRRAEAEGADVLGFHVERVDQTNDPHWLSHAYDPSFKKWLRGMSTRVGDSEVVLSMLGAVSFWRREVIDELVKIDDTSCPVYLEIFLPTVAHHRGFRVCDMGEQNRYVQHSGNFVDRIEEFRALGAWLVHPVK